MCFVCRKSDKDNIKDAYCYVMTLFFIWLVVDYEQ